MANTLITTHDIKVGDIILSHGMKLLIDQEPHQTSHPVNPSGLGGNTYATAAKVLNYDELKEKANGGDSVAIYLLKFIDSDMSEHGLRAANGKAPYSEPRWNIQGNGLAEWILKEEENN